jgi:L-asparaginase
MKRVLIVQTGGTILMQADARQSGPVTENADFAKGYLMREVPELQDIAEIDVIELMYEDSCNLGPPHWTSIAKTIFENYAFYDGFVVLHGTDTLAYTASALSFGLRPLSKPIVLTGSQVPLATLRTDARRNLINSVEIATLSIPEITICFNDKLYRGNRSTKMSIGDFDAFNSPNFLPLADIGLNIRLSDEMLPWSDTPIFSAQFAREVYILKIFPGLNPSLLTSLTQSGVKAILIEGFGSGNFPEKYDFSLIPFLESCRDTGIIMAICSQAPYDAVDLTKYHSGRTALDLGVMSSGCMTLEASVTKLMYLLAHHHNADDIRTLYSTALAGEL